MRNLSFSTCNHLYIFAAIIVMFTVRQYYYNGTASWYTWSIAVQNVRSVEITCASHASVKSGCQGWRRTLHLFYLLLLWKNGIAIMIKWADLLHEQLTFHVSHYCLSCLKWCCHPRQTDLNYLHNTVIVVQKTPLQGVHPPWLQ